MANGSKQEKYTGFTPSIRTAKGSAFPPVESTGKKSASPVLKTVPMKGESLSSEVEVSASILLAVQILMKDFKALKAETGKSWQASSNGKIYWCAEIPGHKLTVVDGKLLVDNLLAEKMLEKLLAEAK